MPLISCDYMFLTNNGIFARHELEDEEKNKGVKVIVAKCAKTVAGTGESVKWITPLGLPCVQPYKTIRHKSVIQTIL